MIAAMVVMCSACNSEETNTSTIRTAVVNVPEDAGIAAVDALLHGPAVVTPLGVASSPGDAHPDSRKSIRERRAKTLTPEQLLDRTIRELKRNVNVVAHVRVTNTTTRSTTGYPSLVTDVQYEVVEMLLGDIAPPLTTTVPGGQTSNVVIRVEDTPVVTMASHFIAFYNHHRHVWTLMHILKCKDNGDLFIAGQTVTTTALRSFLQ